MLKRSLIITGVGGVAALLLSGPAWATVANVKAYKEAYPGKEPKAYSCKTCHEHPMGHQDDLNGLGKALLQFKGEGAAKTLTVEDFRTFEPQDTDKDGVSNLEEMKAGTDPNDPQSTPSHGTTPADATPAGP